MLKIGLMLLGLGAHQPPDVDSVAVYAEILRQVRTEFAADSLVLAKTRSGVDCMPMCGARLRSPDGAGSIVTDSAQIQHSVALLDSLRALRLVEYTCAVRDQWYGCPDYPEHLFVALGEITSEPRRGPEPVMGGVWVKVALLVPCKADRPDPAGDPCHADALGYWYLLQQKAGGGWTIVRRAPGFTAR
jgi:hypothetical protein